MKERLIIRCGNDIYEPYIKLYPKFQKKWLTHDWELVKVIEGYLEDPEFKTFFEYLRTKVKYEYSYLKREYTENELLNAHLLYMWISATFEPTGEELGTKYKPFCPVCEAGRMVKGNLILDLTKVPKGKDIAKTIAEDEWIVSERFADLINEQKITGVELRPVQHKAFYDESVAIAPAEYPKYPSGKQLIERAERAGTPYPTASFWVWLTCPEQVGLYHKLEQEYIQANKNIQTTKKKEKGRRQRKPLPRWYQLIITSTVKISEQTRYGDPFYPNLNGEELKTSCGHAIRSGDFFTELYIKKGSWDCSDIVKTDFYFGGRTHLIYPSQRILISQRFYRLLKEYKIKGYEIEVAHLV